MSDRNKLILVCIFIAIVFIIVLMFVFSKSNRRNSSVRKTLEFINPIAEQRADPWVYRHTDGYYYMTASVPEYDRIEIRKSKTIQGLGEVEGTIVWKKHDSGIMSKHIWAPEIHYIDDKWYIYFAAGEKEDIWKIRPYVLECKDSDPISGKWEEKGIIQSLTGDFAFSDFSLDATTFEHKDKRYLVWAQKVTGISNLYIAEMANPWTISTEPVLISEPFYGWERIGFWVNEGPAVIKRNGKIFMTYSASATDSNYCMGLLTADENSDLLKKESWKKEAEPVFKSNDETGQYGPGHNSFTVSEDGRYDVMIYHARNYKKIEGDPLYDPNRHMRAQVLNWKQDGTPDFGVPVPDSK